MITIHVGRKDGGQDAVHTPEEALSAAARLIRAGCAEDIDIVFADGLYAVGKALFVGGDCLRGKAELRLRAENPGGVRIAGYRFLSGFQPYRDGIYCCNLNDFGVDGRLVHRLYCNGRLQRKARYPSFDEDRPYSGGWLFADGELPEDVLDLYVGGKGQRDRFFCGDRGLKALGALEGAEVFVFPRYNWVSNTIEIDRFDAGTGEIVLKRPADYEIYPGDRFYVQGLLSALDSPGEWFVDADTNTLYVIPPEPIGDCEMAIPTADNLLIVDGTEDCRRYDDMVDRAGEDTFLAADPNRCEKGFVAVEGLCFEGCDGDGVVFRNVKACRLSGCTVKNTGRYGVRLLGGAGCAVSDCEVHHTGHDGICVRGGMRNEHENWYRPSGHRVAGTYIHHVGLSDKCVAGVRLEGTGNRVSQCLIHDGPRWGIVCGGNDHVIEYNHLRHLNLETSDTGAIYFCNRNYKMRGNRVRFNFIHDVYGHHLLGGKPLPPTLTYGIYLDDFTSGTEVYGNITLHTPNSGMFIHNGRDNVVENNLFLDSKSDHMTFNRAKKADELRAMGTSSQGVRGNAVRKNLFASHFPDSASYFMDNVDEAGSIDMDTNIFENNAFWFYGHPVRIKTHYDGRGLSFAEWLALGYEEGGVHADPLLFCDDRGIPALGADSPLLALGFVPIENDRIGPQRAIAEAEGLREYPQDMPE